MFFSRPDQTLYLLPWDFNAVRLINKIAEIAESRGAKLQPVEHKMGMIVNRMGADQSPVHFERPDYLTFVLEGVYYYFQIDDNPFFEHWMRKTPVKDGKIMRNACLQEMPNKWAEDVLLKADCSEADIDRLAGIAFDEMIAAPVSEVIRYKKKQQVPNIYDGLWHLETVLEPIEYEKLKWLP